MTDDAMTGPTDPALRALLLETLAEISKAAHAYYDGRYGEAPRPWIDAALAQAAPPSGLDVEDAYQSRTVPIDVVIPETMAWPGSPVEDMAYRRGHHDGWVSAVLAALRSPDTEEDIENDNAVRAAEAAPPDSIAVSALHLADERLNVRDMEGAHRIIVNALAALAAAEAAPTCSYCGGRGWYVSADPLPSGEPGEPYQVQCGECDGTGHVRAAEAAPLDVALAGHWEANPHHECQSVCAADIRERLAALRSPDTETAE